MVVFFFFFDIFGYLCHQLSLCHLYGRCMECSVFFLFSLTTLQLYVHGIGSRKMATSETNRRRKIKNMAPFFMVLKLRTWIREGAQIESIIFLELQIQQMGWDMEWMHTSNFYLIWLKIKVTHNSKNMIDFKRDLSLHQAYQGW